MKVRWSNHNHSRVHYIAAITHLYPFVVHSPGVVLESNRRAMRVRTKPRTKVAKLWHGRFRCLGGHGEQDEDGRDGRRSLPRGVAMLMVGWVRCFILATTAVARSVGCCLLPAVSCCCSRSADVCIFSVYLPFRVNERRINNQLPYQQKLHTSCQRRHRQSAARRGAGSAGPLSSCGASRIWFVGSGTIGW